MGRKEAHSAASSTIRFFNSVAEGQEATTSKTISFENPRFAKNAAVDKVIIFSIVTTPIFVQCAKATPCNNRPSLLLLYCLFFDIIISFYQVLPLVLTSSGL